MLFVGASWGANLPVTKVMLGHFDLLPLATIAHRDGRRDPGRSAPAARRSRTVRVELGLERFLLLGLIMASFFACYSLGIYFSNPITAATIQVASPLVSAATVRCVTGARFDPGFGVALGLDRARRRDPVGQRAGGRRLLRVRRRRGHRAGEHGVVDFYSIKAQIWFRDASQLQRAYVASLSASGWLLLAGVVLMALGIARSPFGVGDGWVWTQLLVVAVLASGVASYSWNIGASRLGVAVAALWTNLVPFFAVLWSMVYGFVPNAYQIVGGLVALSGVVYMQARKLQTPSRP